MGFGYLFIGYLVVYLLSSTAGVVGLSSVAVCLGTLLLYVGFAKLCRFHNAFVYGRWFSVLLLVASIGVAFSDISAMLLWDIPFLGELYDSIVGWTSFFLSICLQLAILYGVRMLSAELELSKITSAAMRNMLFVSLYAVLYIVGKLPIAAQFLQFLMLATVLLNLACVFLNLLLLLNCTKSICASGDEEIAPKKYRWEWLNRLGDTYEKNQQRMNEQARADGEEWMRRRQEKKRKNKRK